MSKKHQKKQKVKEEQTNNFFESVKPLHRYIILAVLLIIPIFIFMSPYILEGKEPSGSDVIGSKGNVHLYKEYEEETGENALWNPAIFGGMPVYPRINPSSIHIDTIISFLSNLIYHFFWYFLLGGAGLFLFLRQKKIPWYLALIPAVLFVMLPDWQAMIANGHFSKIRAIMILPWLLLTFDYFVEKKTWLSAGLFALAFSWLVRTHHFQIVFYGILILIFLYTYPIIKTLIDKKYKEFGGIILKLAVAIVLTIMTAAQPLLSTQEYAEYSTRGGNPVNIGEEAESAQRTGGVSFEYATRWSLAPREIIDFFVPRFTGGTSAEFYDGDQYPQVAGQQVPGYWGQMPFTDNYDAMGMILFLFALLGFIHYRKNSFILALGIFIVFSVLLALGRHFPFLYNLFYEYMPFFSKFRVPVMFAHITFISTYILAAFGLKALFTELKERDFKKVLYVFGGGILFLIIILLMKGSFAYLGPNEAGRYNPQTLEIIKNIREEFLTTDTMRVLILVALTAIVAIGYLFGKVKKELALVALFVFAFIEIYAITNRQIEHRNLVDPVQLEQNAFKQTPITQYLESQEKNQRALVISQDFQSNYYAYFYPTINGYSAIKLQLIQDIIDHNLMKAQTPDRLNWQVINMLNGRYIVTSSPLNYPFLNKVAEAPSRKEILYENSNSLPKAWFVNEIKGFDTREDLVLFMNEPEFNPDSIALLVDGELAGQTFSGEGTIELTKYTPNEIEISYNTNEEQFLVLSEVYYPEGWNALLENGENLEIYKTNHILRGMKVPAGEHTLTLTFEPQTYYTAMNLVWAGNILILLIISISIFVHKRKIA